MVVWQRIHLRRRSLDRIFAADVKAGAGVWLEQQDWLSRWLSLAGFRSPDAMAWFATRCSRRFWRGLVVFGLYQRVVAQTAEILHKIPGGIGEVFVPVA